MCVQLHVPAIICHMNKQTSKELLLSQTICLVQDLLILVFVVLKGNRIDVPVMEDLVVVILLQVLEVPRLYVVYLGCLDLGQELRIVLVI